jgi:hypothetical protein
VDKKDFLLKAKSEEEKRTWCQHIDQNIITMVLSSEELSSRKSALKGPPCNEMVSGSFILDSNNNQNAATKLADIKQVHFPSSSSSSSEDEATTDEDDFVEGSSSEDDESAEGEDEDGIDSEEIEIEGVLHQYFELGGRWGRRWCLLDKASNGGTLYVYREQV